MRDSLSPQESARPERDPASSLAPETQVAKSSVHGIGLVELERLQALADARTYRGPRCVTAVAFGKRIRCVRDRFWESPLTGTFNDFLITHLQHVLGVPFFQAQQSLDRDQQHVIFQWLQTAAEQRETLSREPHTGPIISAPLLGSVRELLALANDVLRLKLVDRLPAALLDRLRDRVAFQGARYEVAVAAAFVGVGFRIDWIHEPLHKHGEFVATLRDEQLVVEAKSKHRPGTLHELGDPTTSVKLKADVGQLYNRAVEKDPGGKPLVVCIDVNLPVASSTAEMPRWTESARHFFDQRSPSRTAPAKEFCMILTNFNWHFAADSRAPGGWHFNSFPEWTVAAPKNDDTYAALLNLFERYGECPESIEESMLRSAMESVGAEGPASDRPSPGAEGAPAAVHLPRWPAL